MDFFYNFNNIAQLALRIINFIFILFVIFFERKESLKRLFWIALLFLLPGFGFLFYILLSGHFFTGTKRMNEANNYVHSLSKPLIEKQHSFLSKNKSKFPPNVTNEFYQIVEMNLLKGESLLLPTESLCLYTNGEDYFNALCHELENAKSTIYMQYFVYHNDKIGKRIMNILCKKAKEGLEVKLLYDDLGSLFTPTRFFKPLIKAGGKARAFFQIRVGLPFTVNFRNHRKVVIIDSKIAFTGGSNAGDEYENKSRRIKLNWRDTNIRLTGASVTNMETIFLVDWYSMEAWNSKAKTEEKIRTHIPQSLYCELENIVQSNSVKKFENQLFNTKSIPTQVITSGPNNTDKAKIEDAFIKMILSAKKSIFIQTPYFCPDESFLQALKIASYSGVDVRIMIPRDWDKFYVKAASMQFAREMTECGIKFYLYPGFIHSKTITVDSKICSIGTTNIDNRSFNLHFEMNCIFYSKKLSVRHDKIFLQDEEICERADKNYFDKKTFLVRTWWSFCKLFALLM